MICPHCRKAIDWKVSRKAKNRILALAHEGFSLRDMEVKLRVEGFKISFSTIGRILREEKENSGVEDYPANDGGLI